MTPLNARAEANAVFRVELDYHELPWAHFHVTLQFVLLYLMREVTAGRAPERAAAAGLPSRGRSPWRPKVSPNPPGNVWYAAPLAGENGALAVANVPTTKPPSWKTP